MSAQGERAGLIRQSQISAVLNAALVPALAPIIVALILVFVLADSVGTAALTIWLAAVCLLNGFRYLHSKRLSINTADPESTERAARQLLVMIAASGCLWGFAGGFFFLPNDILFQVLLGFALGGLVAGSLSTYGVWLAAFYAFALPAMLPIVMRFFLEGSDVALAMGGMLAIFWLAEAALAHSVNRSLVRSIELQLDKDELVRNLTEAKSVAEEASQAKDQFLSRFSHELRTPMHAILGFGQLLSLDADSDDDRDGEKRSNQRQSIDHIMQAGQHLLNLIDEILNLAKVNAGEITIDNQSVKTQQVLEECIDLIRPVSRPRDIEIKTPDWPVPMPAVLADELRLREVFLNLLSNAVKYNQTGGTITVEVGRTDENLLRVSVRDTGAGIPANQTDEIFKPFTRLDEQLHEVEGTGIGLSITKQLIELMGGHIGFETQEGQGSTFWVDIPLTEDEAAPTFPETAPISDVSLSAPKRNSDAPLSILYIEDNLANRELMTEVCALRNGVSIECAISAEAGLAHLTQQPVDLVLMDIQLPGMDGYEALKKLRALPAMADKPVIAVSANAMPADIDRGTDAGFQKYLTKPINIHDFLAVLDEQRIKR